LRRRLRRGLLIVFALILPASFVAQQFTIAGRMEFAGKPGLPAPDPSGVILWLTPLDNSRQELALPPQRRQLVQKNKTFSPHVLVVTVGSTVDFPNNDPFFHNVFSLFDGRRFDLGLYEAGTSRSIVFNRPGISYIFCNIHPEMSAVILALNTPYYGTSDRKGAISIPNVPPGRYEMQIWHERLQPESLKSLTRIITVSDAASTLGLIRLPEQRSLNPTHKNKYGQDYENPTPGSPGYTRPLP